MMQHPLNLMPEEIRARAEAGQRLRRTITICLSVLLLAGGMATWSRIRFEQAGSQLSRLEALAQQSLDLESQTVRCLAVAKAIERSMVEYQTVALPVPVSSLMAGLVRVLPEGASLDAISLHYDDGTRLIGDDESHRRLNGHIEGFAVSDEAVATLAKRLERLAPFEGVRLEGSRSRSIRGRSARGFTLIFSIDLDQPWLVRSNELPPEGSNYALMEGAGLEVQHP
jgi:hypothetical protein